MHAGLKVGITAGITGALGWAYAEGARGAYEKSEGHSKTPGRIDGGEALGMLQTSAAAAVIGGAAGAVIGGLTGVAKGASLLGGLRSGAMFGAAALGAFGTGVAGGAYRNV